MKFLKVQTLEEASSRLFEVSKDWLFKKEVVELDESPSLILAEDVVSEENLPSFRRSTVDGFAVKSAETAAASESTPVFLKLVGDVKVGEKATRSLQNGECMEVATGAMIPDGADSVVMVEYTENFGLNEIAVHRAAANMQAIVDIGDDIAKGEVVLKKGKRVTPYDIGAMAAIGCTKVAVWKKLKITLVSTGDELVGIGESPELGKIRDISSHSLRAFAHSLGMEVLDVFRLEDDDKLIESTIKDALGTNDIIVVSGGSSYGKQDLTASIIDRISTPGVFTHGLAIKPGKPTILGADEATRTLIIGLPGHPVSSLIVFKKLMDSLFERNLGFVDRLIVQAELVCNIPSDEGKLTIYPCTIAKDRDRYLAEPIFGKSALISTLTKTDGYFTVEETLEGLEAGSVVDVHLFR